MTRKRSIVLAGLLVCALAALFLLAVGCGGDDETTGETDAATATTAGTETTEGSTPSTAAEARSITLYLPLPVQTIAMFPPVVAKELGYFAEEGLDVKIETTDSSTFITQQLASGNGDAGLIVAGTLLAAWSQGHDLVAVYEYLTHPVFDLIVPENSPVKSYADLKGKKVGMENAQGGDIPELVADLKQNGLEQGTDYQLVPLGEDYKVIWPKLEAGEFAAQSASYNQIVNLLANGTKFRSLRPPEDPDELHPSVPLAIRGDLLKEDPNVAVGLGRAMTKAIIFAKANPDAALAIMKKAFPPEHESEDFARIYMERALYMSWPVEEGRAFGLQSIEGTQELVKILVNPDQPSGLEKEFDVTPYVTNDYIEEINNFDAAAVEKQAKESTLTYP